MNAKRIYNRYTLLFLFIGTAIQGGSPKPVDLSDYLDKPVKECLVQVGCQPICVDVPTSLIEKVYQLTAECEADYFEECIENLTKWGIAFSQTDEAVPFMKMPFGIKDRRNQLHQRKEKKYYLQFSVAFA